MNNKKIIDYVMQSPNNTNPAVLESMLEAINGGGYSLAIWGDEMLEAVQFIEELGYILIGIQFVVLLNGIEEMGLSAGTYVCNPESDDDIIQFASLAWGFR